MGHGLGQGKTQTMTQTPKGHNGAESTRSVARIILLTRLRPPAARRPPAILGLAWCPVPRECFILVLLRRVLLPLHLVSGAPSNIWWADHSGEGRSGRGILWPLLPFFAFCLFTLSSQSRLPMVFAVSRSIRWITWV